MLDGHPSAYVLTMPHEGLTLADLSEALRNGRQVKRLDEYEALVEHAFRGAAETLVNLKS